MISKLVKLFKESFIYSTGSLLVKFGGFLIMPLYIDYTTPDEFGLIMLFEIIHQFTQSISGWGIKGGFQRWYYDMPNKESKKSLFFSTFFSTFFTSLLAIAVTYTALLFYSYDILQYYVSTKVITLFIMASLLKMLSDVPFILIRLQQKPVKQTAYQTLNILLTLIATFIALQYLKLGLEGIYWGQLIANGITMVTLLPLIVTNSKWRYNGKRVVEMMKFGAPLVLSNVMIIIFSLSDRYIIAHFKSLEDVGSFSLAFKISSVIQFVVLMPFFTSYSYDYYRYMNEPTKDRYYIKSFTYFIYLMTFAGLGVTLFAKEALFLLSAGSDYYYDAMLLIPIMIVGVIISGMRMVFSLPLQKTKRTKIISTILVISGLLNFILNILVIPKWGKIGAAFTTTISQLFASIWFYQIIKKQEDDTYELNKIFKIMLIGSFLMYLYIFIPKASILIDIILKITFIPLMIFLMYIFKCFEAIEIRKVKKNIIKWKNPSNWTENINQLKNLNRDDRE